MTGKRKEQTAGRAVRLFACLLVLHVSGPAVPYAQPVVPDNATQIEAAQSFNTEQFDALLAPVALYTDTLLTQVLMAATVPLQIVQAVRWADDPANGEGAVRNGPGCAPSGSPRNAGKGPTGSQPIADGAPAQRASPSAQGASSGVNEGHRATQFSQRGGQSRAARQVEGRPAGEAGGGRGD